MIDVETGHRLASVIGLLSRLLDEKTGAPVAGELVQHLTSDHPAVVTAAVSAVARFGDEASVPPLVPLLSSSNLRIRNAAGAALLEIGSRRPDAVVAAIRSESICGASGVQRCRVLEAFGDAQDFDRLIEATNSPDGELRRAGVRALAAAAGARSLPRVESALSDEDIMVRTAAADALALVGTAARESIVRALEGADGPVAAALIRALGKTGHPRAEEILAALCRRSEDMAQCALEAATQLRVPVTEMKPQLLHHSDPEVVKAAMSALGAAVRTEE